MLYENKQGDNVTLTSVEKLMLIYTIDLNKTLKAFQK